MTWLPPEAHPEIKIQAQVTSLEGERNAGREKGSGTEKGVSAGVTELHPETKPWSSVKHTPQRHPTCGLRELVFILQLLSAVESCWEQG